MTYKHKAHAVGSDGDVVSSADIDFSVDDVYMSILLGKVGFSYSYVSDQPPFVNAGYN